MFVLKLGYNWKHVLQSLRFVDSRMGCVSALRLMLSVPMVSGATGTDSDRQQTAWASDTMHIPEDVAEL